MTPTFSSTQKIPGTSPSGREVLREAFANGAGSISLQVLNEFFSSTTRKLGLTAEQARRRIELYSTLHVVQLRPQDLLAAIDLHRLHGFSIWDCLILRAALISGCQRLYTEDLQHGQHFEGLRVVNPFLT